jgi:DNA replication and repair protein RecF
MYLKSLGLKNFRCYDELHLELQPGLVLFLGPNASGKTSLLEAVHLLATTKSHRASQDRDLIKWDSSEAMVAGRFARSDGGEVNLRATISATGSAGGKSKAIAVNGVARTHLRDVVGQANVVLFSPDDLQIVAGGPSERRRFLNTAIGQLKPRYLDDLARYRRALRQRNEFLRKIRDGRGSAGQLEAWTAQLVVTGAQVALDRREFIAALNAKATDLHARLTDEREALELRYEGDLATASEEVRALSAEFAAGLEALGRREIERGTTLMGPHRDDVAILDGEINLRQFGSQGQRRTAALSMKLAEAQVMRSQREEPPVLLLDDCLSELDAARARRVIGLAEGIDQMAITAAAMDPVLGDLVTRGTCYRVIESKVERM